jgi:hypothetical protein
MSHGSHAAASGVSAVASATATIAAARGAASTVASAAAGAATTAAAVRPRRRPNCCWWEELESPDLVRPLAGATSQSFASDGTDRPYPWSHALPKQLLR